MTNDKAALVLNTVITRTEEGKVPWTATSTDEAFEASFEKVSLRVVHDTGQDGNGDDYEVYNLDILNAEGTVVESITAYAVREYIKDSWKATQRLFQKAKDRALGIDATVEELLHDLGGAVPIAPSEDDLDKDSPF
jgi:hypothetical protein